MNAKWKQTRPLVTRVPVEDKKALDEWAQAEGISLGQLIRRSYRLGMEQARQAGMISAETYEAARTNTLTL